jgi:hypothetical protein
LGGEGGFGYVVRTMTTSWPLTVRETAAVVQALVNATKTLIEQERKAHRLDDQAQQQSSYGELLAQMLAA